MRKDKAKQGPVPAFCRDRPNESLLKRRSLPWEEDVDKRAKKKEAGRLGLMLAPLLGLKTVPSCVMKKVPEGCWVELTSLSLSFPASWSDFLFVFVGALTPRKFRVYFSSPCRHPIKHASPNMVRLILCAQQMLRSLPSTRRPHDLRSRDRVFFAPPAHWTKHASPLHHSPPDAFSPYRHLVLVRYHAVYVKEVKRLFDTYKVRHPDYKNKEIIIET